MRRKREEIEEVEEVDEVDQEEGLSEKELKKKKRQESLEKRKNAKRKDKVARWGGIILLGLVMFIGFMLYVLGEIKMEDSGTAPLPRPATNQDINVGRTIIVK